MLRERIAVYSKGKSTPYTGLVQALSFQDFKTIRHMKMVRFSVLRTGHLYLQGNIPVTHFC